MNDQETLLLQWTPGKWWLVRHRPGHGVTPISGWLTRREAERLAEERGLRLAATLTELETV